MIVTVWRHGEAAQTVPDEQRHLTERGRSELALASEGFSAFLESSDLVLPQRIYHSPLVRTGQTADILGEALGVPTYPLPTLAPDAATVQELGSWLEQSQDEHVLLVGHQPFVSSLIWRLLDDRALPPLQPGGHAVLALVTGSRGGASLLRGQPAP